MTTRSEWIWMPHAGHLIVGNDCRFHLATYVGTYLVSTVGEYLPDAPVREILAESRKVELTGRGDARLADYMRKIGYEELGYERKYETMVFRAIEATKDRCCPWRMESGTELEMNGYNEPEAAYLGHLAMCEKWANQQPTEKPS